MPSRSRFAILLACLAALGVPGPSSAVADGSGSVVIANGDQANALAECPAGTKAISGGFLSPDFESRMGAVVRFGSMRTAKKDWRVSAANFGGGPESTGRIDAFAYCQKPPQRVRVVQATAAIEGMNYGSATATCRANEQAVSGGFTSPDFVFGTGAHPLVLSSYRLDSRSWKVDAINTAFDGDLIPPSGNVNVFAFCRKGGPNVVTRSTDSAIPAQQGENSGPLVTTVDAGCPAGSKAVSGGFDAHLAVGELGLNASGPIGSVRLPAGAGWRVKAVSVGELPSTITVQANCERRP